MGSANSYIAELWGALEGLKLAKSLNYTKVELHMASQVIVDCLQGNGSVSMEGRGLIMQIRRLLEASWEVKIIHVYR